jgi:hypothetical protein
MKNPYPREVPVVLDLPPNLMGEIGRVIVFHAYVEWRLSLIVHEFLHLTKVLGRLVARDARATDQFDLICDLLSLKDVKTDVDLIRLRKSLVSVTTQRDLLAHGTWTRAPQTKAVFLRLAKGSWSPVKDQKLKTKQSGKPRTPKYGIEECRSLSRLIRGIILTVDELHVDALGKPAPYHEQSH